MKLYVKVSQILGIIIFSIGFLISSNLDGQTSSFYVSSQSGNDGWSGLLPSPNSSNSDAPFLTLRNAQSVMQTSSPWRVAVLFSIRRRVFPVLQELGSTGICHTANRYSPIVTA
jgi:hypothetical protein